MGIIQEVQDRIARYQYYTNRIEREKLMIDPSSIVLMEEFTATVTTPLLRQSNSYFASLFRLYGTEHNHILQSWISQYAIPVYMMRIADLPELQQHYVLGHLHEEQFNADIEELRDIYEKSGLDFHETEQANIRMRDHQLSQRENVQAVHVRDVLRAADYARYKRGGSLQHHERRSLLRDEGADVLKFWQSVSALRDLSGFFPDKPPPGGNDRRKRKQEARAPVWRPAFGNGF